jgi:hypothetical protein
MLRIWVKSTDTYEAFLPLGFWLRFETRTRSTVSREPNAPSGSGFLFSRTFRRNLVRLSRPKFALRELETGTARATLRARFVKLDSVQRLSVKILLVA